MPNELQFEKIARIYGMETRVEPVTILASTTNGAYNYIRCDCGKHLEIQGFSVPMPKGAKMPCHYLGVTASLLTGNFTGAERMALLKLNRFRIYPSALKFIAKGAPTQAKILIDDKLKAQADYAETRKAVSSLQKAATKPTATEKALIPQKAKPMFIAPQPKPFVPVYAPPPPKLPDTLPTWKPGSRWLDLSAEELDQTLLDHEAQKKANLAAKLEQEKAISLAAEKAAIDAAFRAVEDAEAKKKAADPMVEAARKGLLAIDID